MGELIRKSSTEITLADQRVEIPASVIVPNRKKELYLSNKNFPKIGKIEDKNTVVNEIHAYVNKTIMDKGANYEPDEIKYIKQTVTDDIIRDFDTYTLEEVRLAFHYGVRGELGEYFGINPTTFYGWLKKFRYELMPPITKEIRLALPDPAEVVLTPQEKDKGLAEIINEVYFRLWSTGEYVFFDGGNHGYYLLESLGLLVLEPADKVLLMDKSRMDLKREIKAEDNKLRRKGRKYQRIDIPRAMKSIEDETNPQYEDRVKFGAMKKAVYDYLYGLAEEDVDLKELIDGRLAEKNYNKNEND
jgi:hypothetical protein